MDKLNINNLPPEMLTGVFRYLNGENLKNSTMVCKLWNNLIDSVFRWSLKLAYDEHGRLRSKNPSDALTKMDFILTTNRKFETIRIDRGRLNEDDIIVQLFNGHGFNVVELYLYRCHIDNLTGFAELLSFTPNLKHVVVDTDIHNSPGSNDVLLVDQLLPDLEKLKSLVIRGRDYRIIKCFQKAKLTTMEIGVYMSSEPRSLLVEFLSTQDKLTSLTVTWNSSSILVGLGKLNVPIPFRLTQLSISGIICQKPSQKYDHLVRFIKSQAGNLTEIELEDLISNSVLECVFTNMTKLTTLWMTTSHIPRDNDFYKRLKENCNVHTVRLMDNDVMFDIDKSSIQFVGKFLQKLPNVRRLILLYTEPFVTQSIMVMAQSLGKLESLYIETIHGSSLDCVKFPNLKTLHIEHLRGKINWNEFTKAHPLLTELTIEEIRDESYLTSDDIDQITTNVDLQHIRLGTGFVADNRFFEIVESKCTNLKVLDLEKSSISQNLMHYLKIDVLHLRESITCANVFCLRLFEWMKL